MRRQATRVRLRRVENPGSLRLVAKVARLYHTHGLRQIEIAARLGISQSRVSRLLTEAEEVGIVRTVVAAPLHVHAELEEAIEQRYGVDEVHIVDTVGDTDAETRQDLGLAAASILAEVSLEARTVGWTSWSRTLRSLLDHLLPLRLGTERVVEMIGDLGPPSLQHDAARSTQKLATLLGAEPVFLRTPGVVPSPEVAQALLDQDTYARHALDLLDDLDVAFLSIGTCDIEEPLQAGRNMVSQRQLDELRRAGAVGEVCMRYIDANGAAVPSSVDEVTIGVTLRQLVQARRRWAVVGGASKHEVVRAALRGHWGDVLVTDIETARFLADDSPAGPKSRKPKATKATR